jgi:hypothetical protein
MRLLCLAVLAALLPACRCNDAKPALEAAPEAAASASASEAPPPEIVWTEAVKDREVRTLTGVWGVEGKKPWAVLDNAAAHKGPWEMPYFFHLVVIAESAAYDCGMFATDPQMAYCLKDSDAGGERAITKVVLSTFGDQLRIQVGDDKPVVVKRVDP